MTGHPRDSQRVERAVPARLLWWSCGLMRLDLPVDRREVCDLLIRSFDHVVQAQFADMVPERERQKVWKRFLRAMEVAQAPLLAREFHCGHVLVACRAMVQRVWDAGCYEPCAVFLSAWDTLSSAIYGVTDNGRGLTAAEPAALPVAEAIVGRLHRDFGLWRDLTRNEDRLRPGRAA